MLGPIWHHQTLQLNPFFKTCGHQLTPTLVMSKLDMIEIPVSNQIAECTGFLCVRCSTDKAYFFIEHLFIAWEFTQLSPINTRYSSNEGRFTFGPGKTLPIWNLSFSFIKSLTNLSIRASPTVLHTMVFILQASIKKLNHNLKAARSPPLSLLIILTKSTSTIGAVSGNLNS